MPFDSPDYSLGELIRDIGSGKIQLPDFQREWKWEDDRIASLLASVSLGYPIGVIMLLEISDNGVRFAPRPISGVESTGQDPERLLLDGQQRLTSLYQSFTPGRPVETMDSRGKRLQRWYYLDIAKSLDPEAEREDAILSVPEDRVIREDFGRTIVADYSSIEKECEAGVFPLSSVFDPAAVFAWGAGFTASSPERLSQWNDFLTTVHHNLMHYKLPAIILHKETPKEAVCTVFEKVNTGGVPLNVFELLTATFAADNFRLNDDWKQRKERFNQKPALRSVESTDFLQAVALLATRARRLSHVAADGDGVPPAISCKRRDILRLELEEYQQWADVLTDSFEWAATFLAQERIFRYQDLPYRTQLVPLAAVRSLLGGEADHHAANAKLRQWFWCGVLGELYGAAIETRFARDLEQIVPWIAENGPLPGTVVEASFRAPRLLTMRTRNSAAYKGLYALLMRSECYDWIKRQPMSMATFFEYQVDIHHIFPKAWCEKNGIDSGRCESIVNKTALSFDTNRSIGGRSPVDYVKTVEQKAGVSADDLDVILSTHALDPAALRSGDFDSFFADRSERLLQLISEAMGKEAIREAPEELPAFFEDEPEDLEDDATAAIEHVASVSP